MHVEGAERFDVLPLLVATDGTIAAFGHDLRRPRPNIVIGGVEGLSERGWLGACLRIGHVLIGVQDLRSRCIMTSYDPDSLVRDKRITRDIYRRFEGRLALNCFVIEGGEIAVGDNRTTAAQRAASCCSTRTSRRCDTARKEEGTWIASSRVDRPQPHASWYSL